MKKIILLLFPMFTILLSQGAHGQVAITGGKGLGKVLAAEPVKTTDIYVGFNMSTFMEQTSPSTLAKYYNANLNVTVGMARYLELYLNFVPYQDDQYHLWGQRGDIKLGVKYLTPLATKTFKFGIAGVYKFPTAGMPNVLYDVFSTDKPAWSISALITLDFLEVMPTFPLKFNFNLGYLDHDIYDQYFYSKIDQMLLGAGVKFSVRSFQFYTEYTGEIFLNNRNEVDFNQNSMRITQGIRFLGPWNNTVDMSLDIGITKYDSLKGRDLFHKEYFDWQLRVGITHRFSVYKYFDKTAKLERLKREEELRRLEAIRKKRQKVKQDLKKMKKSLEKKKSDGSEK